MNNIDIDKIKSTVVDYKQVCEMLEHIIKRYVENEDNWEVWKHFKGWDFSNNGENIVLHYSYENFWSNTETCLDFGEDIVSTEIILNFYKEHGENKEK